MRKDGTVTFWQWQRKIGDCWSAIELPATGTGYATPLHDPRWDQTAGGACWQTWGFHGFLSEQRARVCSDLVREYVERDRRQLLDRAKTNKWKIPDHGYWPEFRLAQITYARMTTPIDVE